MSHLRQKKNMWRHFWQEHTRGFIGEKLKKLYVHNVQYVCTYSTTLAVSMRELVGGTKFILAFQFNSTSRKLTLPTPVKEINVPVAGVCCSEGSVLRNLFKGRRKGSVQIFSSSSARVVLF